LHGGKHSLFFIGVIVEFTQEKKLWICFKEKPLVELAVSPKRIWILLKAYLSDTKN
jgi:hypothetical protein